jgi:hypothetical protein
MKICQCKTVLKKDWKFCPSCGKEYKSNILKKTIDNQFNIGTKLQFQDGLYEIYSIRDQYDPKLYFWNVNDNDDQHNTYKSGLEKMIEKGICKVI